MTDIPDHMRPDRSFQGLILTLQRFWADKGCVILQPYDIEMGAGTFHPATTLRALGPKPWKAAFGLREVDRNSARSAPRFPVTTKQASPGDRPG